MNNEESLLVIKEAPAGPYLVTGTFKMITKEGKEEVREGTTALCRCGSSKNKPFCDGTHVQINFEK